MVDGVALARAVFVLRRAVVGRAFRRLLVIAGLIVAGWLIGGLARTAHADEVPRPVQAVGPVLDRAVHEVVTPRAPMHVVRNVATKTPVKDGQIVPPGLGKARVERPKTSFAQSHPRRAQVPGHVRAERVLVRTYRAAERPRPAGFDVSAPVVKHHPVPLPAPAQDGTHSTVGGPALPGGHAGLPGALHWAPARPETSPLRTLGPVPPAVRTAADEPSFAPD